MLAVWLDESPVVGKDQRDPDGWTTGAADTDFLAARLAELANAPNVDVIRMHGAAAEWWSKIETNRLRAESKARRVRDEGAVLAFEIPPDVEGLGRRAALDRQAIQMKGGRRR